MESITQGSRPRPRTQKKKNPRPRTALTRTDRLKAKTGMLEAKDQGHRRKCSQPPPPKKKDLQFFSSNFQNKKVFQNFFQTISKRGKQKRSLQIFSKISGVFQQNFNGSKNSAVLKLKAGQFSRT